MNLNRNNYEEFFLMYVDGELDAVQVQAVEAFVQQNPDLQQELDMLKDAVLSIDDDAVFADKASLYKAIDEAAISTANYQENFLLYVDGELDERAKASVETFVLQNPALQDAFTLLKQTKLEPEFIACPNKEDLYKKEERPVVFMWARRLSVVAAILLFAVMAWMLVPVKKVEGGNDLASSTKTNQGKTAVPATTAPSTGDPVNVGVKVIEQPATATDGARNLTASTSGDGSTNITGSRKNNTAKEPQVGTNRSYGQHDQIIAVQQPVQATQQQNGSIASPTVPKEQQATFAKTDRPNNDQQPTTKIVQTVNTNPAPVAVQPAVYRELNTDEENDSKSVYVGSMEIRKDKINSLFKKAKGLFKKKKDEDDTKSTIASNSRTLR